MGSDDSWRGLEGHSHHSGPVMKMGHLQEMKMGPWQEKPPLLLMETLEVTLSPGSYSLPKLAGLEPEKKR